MSYNAQRCMTPTLKLNINFPSELCTFTKKLRQKIGVIIIFVNFQTRIYCSQWWEPRRWSPVNHLGVKKTFSRFQCMRNLSFVQLTLQGCAFRAINQNKSYLRWRRSQTRLVYSTPQNIQATICQHLLSPPCSAEGLLCQRMCAKMEWNGSCGPKRKARREGFRCSTRWIMLGRRNGLHGFTAET